MEGRLPASLWVRAVCLRVLTCLFDKSIANQQTLAGSREATSDRDNTVCDDHLPPSRPCHNALPKQSNHKDSLRRHLVGFPRGSYAREATLGLLIDGLEETKPRNTFVLPASWRWTRHQRVLQSWESPLSCRGVCPAKTDNTASTNDTEQMLDI